MSTSTKNVVGVDVGGTNIRAAMYEVTFDTANDAVRWDIPPVVVFRPKDIRTDVAGYGASEVPNRLLRQIGGLIDEILSTTGKDVRAIGVDSPGRLTKDGRGIELAYAFNYRQDHAPIPVCDALKAKYGIDIYLENDAASGARGLGQWSPDADRRKALYLTFSTGVGGAMWSQGTVLSLEPGTVVVVTPAALSPNADPTAILPDVGATGRKPGEWGTFCSGDGIAEVFAPWFVKADGRRSMLSALPKIDSASLFGAADAGDAVAAACVSRVAEIAAAGIGSLVSLLSPEEVVLGGSIATENPRFMVGVRVCLPAYLPAGSKFDVTRSLSLTNTKDVVLLGAVANAVRPRARGGSAPA